MVKTIERQPPKRQILSRGIMQAVGIMLLISLPFWLAALVFSEQQTGYTKTGIETTAKIIDKQAPTSDKATGSKFGSRLPTTSYFITYQFPVLKEGSPAGTYRHNKQVRRDQFKDFGIGGSLTIRYETGNPKNHIVTSLEKDNGKQIMLTIALIITVVAAGIAGASLFKYLFYSTTPH